MKKKIERLGRIEYKAFFNRYLRRHAIMAFKQQFPNYGSYENAMNSIDEALRKHAVKWKYNRISVPINELDGPVEVMDNLRKKTTDYITQEKTADAEKN